MPSTEVEFFPVKNGSIVAGNGRGQTLVGLQEGRRTREGCRKSVNLIDGQARVGFMPVTFMVPWLREHTK